MALLKVSKAQTSNKPLKVTTNKGMQGSTYNPQRTVPGHVIQGSNPYAPPIQGGNVQGSWLQGGSAALLQRARQQAALQVARLRRIAEQQRIARLAAERERKRKAKQAQVDKAKSTILKIQKRDAAQVLDRLALNKNVKDWRTFFDASGNFKAPDTKAAAGYQLTPNQLSLDSRYNEMQAAWAAWYNSDAGLAQRTQDEYRRRAQKIIDDSKKGPTDFWGKLIDKVTFGGTRRAMGAREQAAKFYQETMKGQVKRYEDMTSKFLKQQAAKAQAIQGKKFGSWAEYNKAVADYKKWESSELQRLEYARAATTGTLEGYEGKSKEQINNLPGKVGNWLYKNVVTGPIGQVTGNLWKYTLGSGDENLPSLVTAPSRAVNWVGNLFNKNGQKNLYGGGTVKGFEKGKNAWTQTFNQRNFNIEQPKKFTQAGFEKWYKTRDLSQWRDDIKAGRIDEKKVKNLFLAQYKAQIDADKWANYATEFVADPLSLLGFTKAAGLTSKGSSFLSKTLKPLGESKFIKGTANALGKVKSSKPVSWLRAEAKTPQQSFLDAQAAAKRSIDDAQRVLLPRLRARNAQLAKEKGVLAAKFDDSIIDEFRKLAEQGDDEAAKFLQTMVNGDFSTAAKIKNWTRAGGLGSNPRLTRLKDIADRWLQFSENMRKADKVEFSSYGKGKKRSFYSPRVDYTGQHDALNYDFTKAKKFHTDKHAQSAEDLYRNVVERYFKSDVIDYWGDTQKAKVGQLDKEMQDILSEYDQKTTGARAATQAAYKKTRTPYGRLRGFTGKFGPTSLWKKSVLKYRPAWYVNNFLYNTQGAGLAGGARGIIEQFRLMRPKNYRAALAELPADVRTQVANEIGKGKISKFGSAVENVSRMGAYRALIKKGYSHDRALKRVNSYLFDYSTKNYERPLRAVMPFYSFQKGLAKAAVKMPFDRPGAAMAYNRLDRYQKQQFDTDFAKIVPQLKKYGYTDQEIEQIRNEQAKYYAGRLKVGDRYITTPFNAFSEKGGFAGAGINPWLSAFAETAAAKDSWGRDLLGADANIGSRLLSKFPQAELAKKGLDKFLVASGRKKPTKSWIGAPGSGGYGMTKQAQGYDPSKPNYQQQLDPGAKFDQDLAAFFGVPRNLKFDSQKLVEHKKLQKLKEEYFAIDWKDMPFPEQEKRRNALFKKYGMSSSDFYDGELSKYDTAHTKHIKAMKEEAFNKTRSLFDEYSRQPKGTRNVWATKKLKELVDQGYFAKNPFLKSFDWIDPGTIGKAYKKMAYDRAKSTGKWSEYTAKYGTHHSQKSIDYKRAKATGDWSDYNRKYGVSPKAAKAVFWASYYNEKDPAKRRQLLRDNPNFAKKQPKSEAAVAEAKFWSRYAAANKTDRRQLLKDNPKYNRRGNWSDQMWNDWKTRRTAETRRRAAKLTGFTEMMNKYLEAEKRKAAPVIAKKTRPKSKKLVFSTR